MSPRRPRSPLPLVIPPGLSRQLFHRYTPGKSSYLVFPPSPTSLRAVPRTPLTPPPRLHLRTVLPSPPLSPDSLGSLPEAPLPWIWCCHQCGQTYKLGVTRRCLHDGHIFCVVPQKPGTPPSTDDDKSSAGLSAEKVLSATESQRRKTQRRRQKTKRQKRRAVGCSARFDYRGWAEYNSWRRCVKIYKVEKAVASRRENDGCEEYEKELDIGHPTQKNCWNDCEYPSECHNIRYEEEHERRHREFPVLTANSELAPEESSEAEVENPISESEEEKSNLEANAFEIEEWQAHLRREELAEFERQERELDEFAAYVYGSPPLSLSRFSSRSLSSASVAEEMDIVEMERRGQEGEAQLVDVRLGPIPSSQLELEDDEIYSSEFMSRHRRKSIQKIAQLTGLMIGMEPVERGSGEGNPKSPLKEGYTSDEKWNEALLVDRQIEEEKRRGSIYRRRVGRGEVGEFGDEDEDDEDDS